MVREGEADFAVTLESAVPRGMHSVRWKKVVPVLVLPKGHVLARKVNRKRPVTVEDIASERLIAPPASMKSPGHIHLEEAARRKGLSLQVSVECSNVELSSRLVEKGLGITFATIIEGGLFLSGRSLVFLPLDHLFPAGWLTIAMREEAPTGPRGRFLGVLLES